ncbi:MAG: hypothetical protein H6620_06160 [Halobacteriovoraceae bacterium]|nr:hypothetical protein [Halobacteriovoraceae bacterium]
METIIMRWNQNFVLRMCGIPFSLVMLLTMYSCGKTDFYAKDISTQSISPNPDEEGGGWGDPGDDDTDVDFGDPTRDTVVDEFIADEESQRPLDILWVIDNSGSMENEQQALANNFSSFISQFVLKEIDFNMAIITTDASVGIDGEPVSGSMAALTYNQYLANSNQFFADFSNMIKVGSTGSGYEKGLQSSKSFFDKYSASFVRDDSNLVVVYVSDEEDQSSQSVESYTSSIIGLKPANSMVQIHAVVRTEILESGNGVTSGGWRYVEATKRAKGSYEQITNDFGQTLSKIGTDIINKIENFVLSKVPDLKNIKVYVNGDVQYDGWSYNSQKNSIEFDAGHEPVVGSEIVVAYLEKK